MSPMQLFGAMKLLFCDLIESKLSNLAPKDDGEKLQIKCHHLEIQVENLKQKCENSNFESNGSRNNTVKNRNIIIKGIKATKMQT